MRNRGVRTPMIPGCRIRGWADRVERPTRPSRQRESGPVLPHVHPSTSGVGVRLFRACVHDRTGGLPVVEERSTDTRGPGPRVRSFPTGGFVSSGASCRKSSPLGRSAQSPVEKETDEDRDRRAKSGVAGTSFCNTSCCQITSWVHLPGIVTFVFQFAGRNLGERVLATCCA